MALEIVEINHVQICVPISAEEASKHFYGAILGLQEIPKPAPLRGRGGAWYRHGSIELHLSTENSAADNRSSRRHICFVVADLTEAEAALRGEDIDIIPDTQPIEGWRRFYVHDPGGNRIEVAERSGAMK
jgi:catechol 2,3-dioxygenase-like lactoylglutathione lyase family enzyme